MLSQCPVNFLLFLSITSPYFQHFQIHFQGRPILNYFSTATVSSKPVPAVCAAKLPGLISIPQSVESIARTAVHKEVQVDAGQCPIMSSDRGMSNDEQWLNERLSTCVVRLLKQTDFLPNADLPNGFWTEDFSKVKLPVSFWNSVDCWWLDVTVCVHTCVLFEFI